MGKKKRKKREEKKRKEEKERKERERENANRSPFITFAVSSWSNNLNFRCGF